MASRAWSIDDIQVLEQHANNDDWLDVVSEQFPERSPASIKTKMSKLRSELGIKGRRGAREEDQDRMNAKSVVASQALLEATLRLGRWS
jgi:hypothetical protein